MLTHTTELNRDAKSDVTAAEPPPSPQTVATLRTHPRQLHTRTS